MLNALCKYIFNKEIALYKPHRQLIPLVANKVNRSNYIFINVLLFWKVIPFKSKNKNKFRLMYTILSCINPKLIIDINWISKWESLYLVWTKKNTRSKFVTVQHGSYVAGVVHDPAHKYTKCDIFLTWSDYFKELFESYNKGKSVDILSFGNPVYNAKDRNVFTYTAFENNKNVLLVPSVIDNENLAHYSSLIEKLKTLGFKVFIKEHAFQGKRVLVKNKQVDYPVLKGINKIENDLENIFSDNNFDFIISDHSTALLDAIFFKNKVLYFSPKQIDVTNKYSEYMINIFENYKSVKSKNELYALVSIDNQERLLSALIKYGDNIITID